MAATAEPPELPALPRSVFDRLHFTPCRLRDLWIGIGQYFEMASQATTPMESGGDLGRSDGARTGAEYFLGSRLTQLCIEALGEVPLHERLLADVADEDARKRALAARRAENMKRAFDTRLERDDQAELVAGFPQELLERAGTIMGCDPTREAVCAALRARLARGFDARSDEQRTLADQVAFLVAVFDGDSVLGAKTPSAVADALGRIDSRTERAGYRAAARAEAERRARILAAMAARNAADEAEPGGAP